MDPRNAGSKQSGAASSMRLGAAIRIGSSCCSTAPQKNAFVLPGGQVGFYRGLYEICDRDDYMATVLGHETGHVTGRHAAERYSREAATQTALQVAGASVNSQLAMAALGLGAQVGLSLPFSREQEAEADILGINYMHAAGYDPQPGDPVLAAYAVRRWIAAAGIPVDAPRSR